MSAKLLWKESYKTDLTRFQRRLNKFTNLKVELKVNDNRSTMLNLLERRRGSARLSMHRMFLDAPDEVLAAVALYVQGKRCSAIKYNQILRTFIQSRLPFQDYSDRLDPARLKTKGRIYDLQSIYEQLNQHYFDGKLNLTITWYGRSVRSKRPRQITYGQYHDVLKLIKIHRLLDDPFFPPYFVYFVVYHEMVHAVVPGEIDKRGIFRVHTPAFKQCERRFAEYKQALEWEKKHLDKIFCHGRT